VELSESAAIHPALAGLKPRSSTAPNRRLDDKMPAAAEVPKTKRFKRVGSSHADRQPHLRPTP